MHTRASCTVHRILPVPLVGPPPEQHACWVTRRRSIAIFFALVLRWYLIFFVYILLDRNEVLCRAASSLHVSPPPTPLYLLSPMSLFHQHLSTDCDVAFGLVFKICAILVLSETRTSHTEINIFLSSLLPHDIGMYTHTLLTPCLCTQPVKSSITIIAVVQHILWTGAHTASYRDDAERKHESWIPCAEIHG